MAPNTVQELSASGNARVHVGDIYSILQVTNIPNNSVHLTGNSTSASNTQNTSPYMHDSNRISQVTRCCCQMQAIEDLKADSISGALAQRPLSYREMAPMRHYLSHCARDQQTGPKTINTHTIYGSTKASVRKKWFNGCAFNIEYYNLDGKKKKCSLLFRARIFRSHMIVLQLYGPFPGADLAATFRMSIRNLIPDDSAILEACKRGDGERVRYLLKSGNSRPNDISLSNNTALSIAIEGGYEEIVQLLLREGADPNLSCGEYQDSPLQMAVYHDMSSIVRILLQNRADPEYTAGRGWSLLHFMFRSGKSAANTEYFPIFGDCLSFDGIKDSVGWTALHRCAAFGTAEDVHFLRFLGASAYVDRYTTNYGLSPIHVAARWNNRPVLEALINLQTNQTPTQKLPKEVLDILNVADVNGWTPLHHAVYLGATDTMKWLLLSGADPHRTTYSTASWFPNSYEGNAFTVGDLTRFPGTRFGQDFIEILKGVGYDATIDGEDIYWVPNEGNNE
ncbi:ankyrin repeat-containing domain protein [Nemania abortiva]|nr:ankyrin repeat-containing domain protein [Nemania abortiva]